MLCDAGKVFVYWLGIEPFVYVADPEFLSDIERCIGEELGKTKCIQERQRANVWQRFGYG